MASESPLFLLSFLPSFQVLQEGEWNSVCLVQEYGISLEHVSGILQIDFYLSGIDSSISDPELVHYSSVLAPFHLVVQEAGMQHAGIAAAGLGAHVAFLLKHGDGQLVAGHFARNRAAHHAAADDDDVIALHGRYSFRVKKGVENLFLLFYHTRMET